MVYIAISILQMNVCHFVECMVRRSRIYNLFANMSLVGANGSVYYSHHIPKAHKLKDFANET